MAPSDNSIGQITEHLFRETYQEVFSSLVIQFGTAHIDLIEDALQETFYKALKSWKHDNYPANPKGWLFTVTKNHIVTELRRNAKSSSLDALVVKSESDPIKTKQDDQLKLLLACTKLKVHPKTKLIFTLKAICGFGVTEIANSLQISEENVYKQLQRGKQKLRKLPKTYFTKEIPSRFDEADISYIELIIYFMFNEGYDAVSSSSESAINEDICFEAVRLAHLLLKFSKKESSKHLLSLFYFHMARFNSRLNEEGDFISLRTQDRSQWDRTLITIGFDFLTKPNTLNRFYIEALIASTHTRARTFSETDWEVILKLYDMLLRLNDSSIVRLNRAICLFELGKTKEATKELKEIKDSLADRYLYYSVSMAEYLEDKDVELSRFWYQKSLEQTKQGFRKQLIRSKLNNLEKR